MYLVVLCYQCSAWHTIRRHIIHTYIIIITHSHASTLPLPSPVPNAPMRAAALIALLGTAAAASSAAATTATAAHRSGALLRASVQAQTRQQQRQQQQQQQQQRQQHQQRLLLAALRAEPTPATAAAEGITPSTPPSEAQGTGNTGACQWMISCQMCTGSEGCGWCTDCGRCVEGGPTGPSATNCVAWDYEQCSGTDTYADKILEQHKDELEERSRLVAAYHAERDNYVKAREEAARTAGLVSAVSAAEGSAASVQSSDSSETFKIEEAAKSTAIACSDAQEKRGAQDTAVAELKAKVKSYEELGATLAQQKDAALEGGASDTTEADTQIAETKALLEGASTKLAEEEATLKTDADAEAGACGDADAAKEAQMKHAGEVKGAGTVTANAKQMVSATKEALKGQQSEARRAKARALEISGKIRALTATLAALRKAQTANDGAKCTTAAARERDAQSAITEWTECSDCQKAEQEKAAAKA